MKTVLAILCISVLAFAPAAAETTLVLRGTAKSAEATTERKFEAATPRASDTTPTKKARIVLASPYGN